MRIQMSTLAFVIAGSVALAAAPSNAQTQAEVQLWDSTWAAYQANQAIPLADRGVLTASQDLSIVINAPIKDVFDIYSNVYNAQGLHPFLIGVTPIRHTNNRLDFIAMEDIPLGDGTIFHAITVAQQRFNRAQRYYDADTYDFPGIITHQHITFTKIGKHQTQVTEHLSFEAPPIYIGTAIQGGVYAHYLVQLGLKAKIEAGLLTPVKFPKWPPGAAADDCDDDNDD